MSNESVFIFFNRECPMYEIYKNIILNDIRLTKNNDSDLIQGK